jgi:transposase-like protein
LSLREVEELMLERGVDVSYETIRRWTVKFGPLIAHVLRRRQPRPGDVWHLDEVVVKIAGRSYWLWRAVDQHGVVLEEILQSKRNKRAAKRLLVKLMKRCESCPNASLRTNCDPMAPQNARSRPALIIGHTRGSTTAPRTATCHSENASGQCRAFGRRVDYNTSSPSIPRPAIVSLS